MNGQSSDDRLVRIVPTTDSCTATNGNLFDYLVGKLRVCLVEWSDRAPPAGPSHSHATTPSGCVGAAPLVSSSEAQFSAAAPRLCCIWPSVSPESDGAQRITPPGH